MNDTPPPIQDAPRKRRSWGWILFAVLAATLLALSLTANTILLGALAVMWPLTEDLTETATFKEKRIGGDADAENKVAVIHVLDLISFSIPGHTGEEGMVGDIKEQLAKARRDENVKAIIVAIDSPGGEVTAADVIHHAIQKARKGGFPVVASLGPLAASGGYYVAAGADWIVAHPTTLTGSIGVIFHLWNYRGLMNKIGLKPMVYKSGKMKDMLSPEKEESEITEEERKIVEQLVMADYDRFVQVVADGRKLKVDDLKRGLADGRVLGAQQALEAKFVDQLGYFEDAFAKALSLAKIERAKLVKYESLFSLKRLLSLFADARAPTVRLQMTPETFPLESGRLYYLPPAWLR